MAYHLEFCDVQFKFDCTITASLHVQCDMCFLNYLRYNTQYLFLKRFSHCENNNNHYLNFFYSSCQVTWTQDEQPSVENYKSWTS